MQIKVDTDIHQFNSSVMCIQCVSFLNLNIKIMIMHRKGPYNLLSKININLYEKVFYVSIYTHLHNYKT